MASLTSTRTSKRIGTAAATVRPPPDSSVVEADHVTRVAKEKFQDASDDNLDRIKKIARIKPTAAKISAHLSADGWKTRPRGATRTLTSSKLVPIGDLLDLVDAGDGLLICVYRLSPIVGNKKVEYAVYRCPTLATVRSFAACFKRLLPRADSGLASPGANIGSTSTATACQHEDVFCPAEVSDTESMRSESLYRYPLHVPPLRTARCNKFDDALRGKRASLVEKMEPSDNMLNLLQDTNVLMSKQVIDIKKFSAQNQRSERNERLLNLLVMRPDDRFPRFIVTLLATGQREIAKFVAGDEFNAICDANPDWCETQQRAEEFELATISSSGSLHRQRQDSFQDSFRTAAVSSTSSFDPQQSINCTCTLRSDNTGCELRRRAMTSSVTMEPAPARDDVSVTDTGIQTSKEAVPQSRKRPASPVTPPLTPSRQHLLIVKLLCCVIQSS